MTTDADSPLVQQRRLLSELRRIREAAGLLQKDVASALDWSVSKLVRIETGAINFSTGEVLALLKQYGVKDQEKINELVEIARRTKETTWWRNYHTQFSNQFSTSPIADILHTAEFSERRSARFSQICKDLLEQVIAKLYHFATLATPAHFGRMLARIQTYHLWRICAPVEPSRPPGQVVAASGRLLRGPNSTSQMSFFSITRSSAGLVG